LISSESALFYQSLRSSFPECAEAAVAFYRDAESLGNALIKAVWSRSDLRTASRFRQLRAFWPGLAKAAHVWRKLNDTTDRHLAGTSARFRQFIDAQLQLFAQCRSADCAYPYACVTLSLRSHGFFAIEGGAGSLANILAKSIAQSGGAVRLNAPVLRLAYDASGYPIGVTLLSGETLRATRAIISNLTVWTHTGS